MIIPINKLFLHYQFALTYEKPFLGDIEQINLNFIAALRRVVKADPTGATNLHEEIIAMPVLAEKEWLLEQTGG